MSGIVNSTGARSGVIGTTVGSGGSPAVGTLLGAAFLADVTDGTGGASSTSNTLRRLTTVHYEVGFGVTLSTNEWTFDNSGTYLIQASAPAYKSNRSITTLYSGTGSTLEATGTAEYSLSTDSVTNRSFLFAREVISASQITGGGSVKSFGIYTIVNNTDTDGFGVDAQDSTAEEYTQVQIFKIQE